MDCLQTCAFPKRKLDGITAEKILCSLGCSVALATDAADMPRFVGSLIDAVCNFMVEAGSTDFFMIVS